MSESRKSQLIQRINKAHERGTGTWLSADDVRLLFWTPPQPAEDNCQHVSQHEPSCQIPSRSPHQLDVQIRWLIRRDMAEVLRIEDQSFEFAWTEEDFLCCLRQRNCIGMVAEREHEIVGFMIYELHKSRLNILNFAVAPEFRRQGVASQMVMRLVDKLSQQRRKDILLEVRERNLDAQMFFKTQNFRAVRVLRAHYDDTAEDAYVMRYRLPMKREQKGSTR